MLQLLIAPLVKQQEQTSTTHLCYSFWLPLWYLLIAPLVSTDCSFGISWLPFGISWLPLWYFETFLILHAYVRASGWSFGIYWLPIWYLLIAPLVSWLYLWYILIASLISSDCAFGIFKLFLNYMHKKQLLISPLWSSWSWSYGSWIYNYLCNQCLSPLTLWVRVPLMARYTRYNIMWWCLSVTCVRSVGFSGFLHQ